MHAKRLSTSSSAAGKQQSCSLHSRLQVRHRPQEKRQVLGLCLPSKCTTPRRSTQARTAHELLRRSNGAHTVTACKAQARSARQPTVAPFDGAQSQRATGGAVPRRPPSAPSNTSAERLTTKAPTHSCSRPQGPSQQCFACFNGRTCVRRPRRAGRHRRCKRCFPIHTDALPPTAPAIYISRYGAGLLRRLYVAQAPYELCGCGKAGR